MAEEQSKAEARTLEDWFRWGRRWMADLEDVVQEHAASVTREQERLERARAGWEADAEREAKNARDWREAAEAARLELEQAHASKSRLVEATAKAAADLVATEAELAEARDLRLKGVTRISQLEVELEAASHLRTKLMREIADHQLRIRNLLCLQEARHQAEAEKCAALRRQLRQATKPTTKGQATRKRPTNTRVRTP